MPPVGGAHYGDHDNQPAAGTRTASASAPARERAELQHKQTQINDGIAQQHAHQMPLETKRHKTHNK